MKSKKFFAIFCAMLLAFTVCLVAAPVKVIAIHYGNPEYEDALEKADYPDFDFYHTDGSTYYYTQVQKLLGNPNYLPGNYGEIPEKMGFSANYAIEKGGFTSGPYSRGIIYIVDKNGIIAGKTSADARFNESNYSEDYYANYDVVKANLKKLSKGKYAKAAKKMTYIPKETASGELEPYGKSKIDKANKGLIGWTVPEITIYDMDGEAHKLNELTAGENCVVIFYSMDAVLQKQGDVKDGHVIKEWYEVKPVNMEKEMLEATQNPKDPKDLLKAFAKTVGESVSNSYGLSTGSLNLVKKVLENVKLK